MSSSILITGGTGFLGQAIVGRLLEHKRMVVQREAGGPWLGEEGDQFTGYDRICIYSRGEHAQAEMRARFGDDPRLRWFVGDVRDQERLFRALDGVDDVIHAAALKRVEVGEYNPTEMARTNVGGTMALTEAARWAGVQRLVLVSSDKAVEPINTYGASKMLAEKVVLSYGYTVVRYGNVAGSTGSVIPTWRAAVAAGRPVIVRDSDATRFWLTAPEAVDLVLEALLHDNEVVVPSLPAFRVGTLALAMGLHDTRVAEHGELGSGEKMHEVLEPLGPSSELARMMTVDELGREIERLGL